ncbi:hypothetical protein JIG36_42705 [Actinoplanes sp. LDG1-06]|uniref:Uncharacterized protein n=1 Tax=Paractinoplanes ovalisporus TaxID=2810368 RepID=A0ABS2AQX6_9ACTN|nr:hypothetical protein [Actinoplanes ovalisporus]MBM2622235.1 hypothetical protein [Actinoplanes ovalisporus]
MSDAFVSWFRSSRTSAEEFLALVEDLESAGVSIVHKAHGTAVLLNVEGDHVPMAVDEVARLIELAIAPLHITWWDGAGGLLSLFEANAIEGETQIYYLDGQPMDLRERLTGVLRRRIRARPDETVGLVLDNSRNPPEYDWERFMRYGPVALGPVPDLLVLSAQLFEESVPGHWREDFHRGEDGLYVLTRGR